MKKISILTIALVASLVLSAQEGNYLLIIDSDTLRLDVDTQTSYVTPGGEELSVRLTQPQQLVYEDDMISFLYDRSQSVSNSEIEEGIEQCVVVNSTGNGFMVQKYETIDPSMLARLMLNELIKESVSYGYEKTEEAFSRQLASGQTIEGYTAKLTYDGEDEYYTVATFGEGDRGIIVITMLLSTNAFDENAIELFLSSLQMK